MTARTLDSAPRVLPLLAKAAAPMVPLAGRLPFVPGGKEIPDLELKLDGATADPGHLARYAKVCGFRLSSTLPPTFPHILAFPLQMAVMTDGSFPFGPIGLVHLENTIVQHRPIASGEALDISVRPTKLEPHPKGRTFGLVTEARAGDELVWEETSTMLRRGGGEGDRDTRDAGDAPDAQPRARWRLPGDLGRRYGAVSGDRNPIHMSDLSARLFGFPKAIAHGMWTAARCLAALEGRLPDAFETTVRFKTPILLPRTVTYAEATAADGTIHFAVTTAKPHLEGTLR